jgi:hypothetical protein
LPPSEWLLIIRYVNGVLFKIWSFTNHNNIEKVTIPCTTILQKIKFTNFYKMGQIWCELFNRECGEGLADVKIDSVGIEKISCTGAWYINDNSWQWFCWSFHLQIIFECACIGIILVLFALFFSLMFRVSHKQTKIVQLHFA